MKNASDGGSIGHAIGMAHVAYLVMICVFGVEDTFMKLVETSERWRLIYSGLSWVFSWFVMLSEHLEAFANTEVGLFILSCIPFISFITLYTYLKYEHRQFLCGLNSK